MKILIINIDSKIPNLALKKIEKYHLDKGDSIIWDNELMASVCDKIYVSCVFDWNKNKAKEWEGKAIIGGSGYSLDINLPKEIDEIKPRINFGFTTRGCIRKCPFCIVPRKEGNIQAVGDIYDIWDGKSKDLMIMDNNILALPNHFKLISSQLRKEKLRVDFNQGLDHRLLTEELANELLSLRHIQEIRFAFDDISYEKTVIKTIGILKKLGMRDWGSRWYIYVGEEDNFNSVYSRMELLRQYKQAVYVMRDRKISLNPQFIALASWGNTMGAFKMDFKELFDKSKRIKPYKKYFSEELKELS